MTRGRVAVVIVSYECAALLRSCLTSLREQRGVECEVVVVDNQSSDGTADLVEREFPEVTLVRSGANRGFAWASNRGMELTRADPVLLLNPDTILPPDALCGALAQLRRDDAVGMLGVRLLRPDGSLDHACKRGFPTPGASLAYFAGLGRIFPRHPRLAAYVAGHVRDDVAADVDAISGAFMLVRRDALAEVGPLDEGYWMYGEDLDWCWRFQQAGWRVRYWPGVDAVHVKGGSSGRFRAWRTNRAFHASMWRFYRLHLEPERPWWVTAVVGAAIAARMGVVAVLGSLRRTLATA